jgi:hypothetical protein
MTSIVFLIKGYSEGGIQIQPFRSAGLMNFDFNNNVTLIHNTYIYITAIATNAAGLYKRTNNDLQNTHIKPKIE